MKLRNKKTGKIVEPFGITCINGRTFVQFDDGKGTFKFEAHSLAELNEEWEDYEEPKEYWYIDWTPKIGVYYTTFNNTCYDNRLKAIGNYFETKEEAEKAVEKLKAWKRLKDKGFRFVGVRPLGKVIDFDIPMEYYCDEHFDNKKSLELFNDLKLLFGGEE